MLRLVLDENISPSIVPLLWAEGIDSYSIRDRDKLRISDHRLFALANEEGRAIATINRADFERLARRAGHHAGIIVIPSGGTRSIHFEHILRAVRVALANEPATMNDQVFYVSEEGDVRVETTGKTPTG